MALLTGMAVKHWRAYTQRWSQLDQVVLYAEMQKLLTQVACEWADVPLADSEAGERSHQLTALFDSAGAIGPRHWHARKARKLADRWMEAILIEVRSGRMRPTPNGALHTVAWHRDHRGQLLPVHTAAVEILNIVRPLIAVSVFIVFAAHALIQYPECRERIAAGERGYAELFLQEVRRFYPFFPALTARVSRAFEWNGYLFPQGQRVMLDLYGTNHDSRAWAAPDEFQPERFRDWDGGAFNFVPQGGGDPHAHHRCPGESITMELMQVAVAFLVHGLRYEVPKQDLALDFRRLPALPRSNVILRNVSIV
jgi:fatty-acid peroxygenase